MKTETKAFPPEMDFEKLGFRVHARINKYDQLELSSNPKFLFFNSIVLDDNAIDEVILFLMRHGHIFQFNPINTETTNKE